MKVIPTLTISVMLLGTGASLRAEDLRDLVVLVNASSTSLLLRVDSKGKAPLNLGFGFRDCESGKPTMKIVPAGKADIPFDRFSMLLLGHDEDAKEDTNSGGWDLYEADDDMTPVAIGHIFYTKPHSAATPIFQITFNTDAGKKFAQNTVLMADNDKAVLIAQKDAKVVAEEEAEAKDKKTKKK